MTLGAVAGLYLVLTAELVAWVQVLLYVGAVVVLLLFAVMLTRAPIGASDDLDRPRWAGVLVGGGAGLGLAALLGTRTAGRRVDLPRTGGRPNSSARRSSGPGCSRSRSSRCCCWPLSSGRSWCPGRTSAGPTPAPPTACGRSTQPRRR